MTEPALQTDLNDVALKATVTEAAEKIKKLSEDLRTKIQGVQHGAEDKALENLLRKMFAKVHREKPESSRSVSCTA